MSVTREEIVAELRTAALIEALNVPRKIESPTGTDGERTCQRCRPLAEQEATHRAENQLITAGPVPAQEAVALTHLVRRAALARAKGQVTVKLYVPKEAEAANVSKATMTRALNKLRAAETETLPFTIADSWKNGKQRVAIVVPPTIGDDAWTERRAFQALSRARLAEERKKQGGSDAAVAARWNCPDHPEDAVVETISKHYRCTACQRSWSAPATVRRHPGANDPIQLESGSDDGPVEIFGASFVREVNADPHQVATANSLRDIPLQFATGEHPTQVEAGCHPSRPVSFVTRDDLEWADDPHYWGDSPPVPPPPPRPLPVAPAHHRPYWARPEWREHVQALSGGRERPSGPKPANDIEERRERVRE